ncbi:hypothetical protein [Candidatus Enterococcus clewellii]|uniref:Uncharacterized protein n=1 Tax=Candidatus Enterococcus clewellii TaxID=1834193 RepID=A0A242K8R3_9ENTE|nr:hypothetical protein [Enterococcus sp. 9E7_DIV0242]OTP17561.1 hypothetical protein A5888_001699 [Enterococcus sp. 9E7_DIV0242]
MTIKCEYGDVISVEETHSNHIKIEMYEEDSGAYVEHTYLTKDQARELIIKLQTMAEKMED